MEPIIIKQELVSGGYIEVSKTKNDNVVIRQMQHFIFVNNDSIPAVIAALTKMMEG